MNIKKDFPIFQRKIRNNNLIYLDSAATSQKPSCVIDAVSNFYKNYNANVHRGLYDLSEESTSSYLAAKKTVADFITCEAEEIIFTKNATESINLVAYTWAIKNLKEGDNIVVSLLEHHSNILPWQMIAKKNNVELRFINIKENCTLDLDHYKSLLDDRTKLVAITHVSNTLGVINPIKEIIDIAHNNQSKILVDACQSVPHMKVNIHDLECDFLAFSGHKIMAPMGIGVLYGKKEILENMEPFLRGGGMITDVSNQHAVFQEIPWKFEAGTPNVEGVVGLKTAIEYVEKLGIDKIRQHEIGLLDYAIQNLQKLDFIKLLGPLNSNIQCGIISFVVDSVHDHDVAAFLNEKGICVRAGKHCTHPLIEKLGVGSTVRASFYVYNSKEDVDKLVEGLKEVYQLFNK